MLGIGRLYMRERLDEYAYIWPAPCRTGRSRFRANGRIDRPHWSSIGRSKSSTPISGAAGDVTSLPSTYEAIGRGIRSSFILRHEALSARRDESAVTQC